MRRNAEQDIAGLKAAMAELQRDQQQRAKPEPEQPDPQDNKLHRHIIDLVKALDYQ